MATPSLYSYFDSKHALYDAMFVDGWAALLEFDPPKPCPDLRTTLRANTRRWMAFSVADPVRFQLLNQRTIPGFEPSRESYAVAQAAYQQSFAQIEAFGELTQADRDLWTAIVGGLVTQQISNDPGGTRWLGLIDDAVDLFVGRVESRTRRRSAGARRRTKPRSTDELGG
jgi:AcrR family transcriptional regulator